MYCTSLHCPLQGGSGVAHTLFTLPLLSLSFGVPFSFNAAASSGGPLGCGSTLFSLCLAGIAACQTLCTLRVCCSAVLSLTVFMRCCLLAVQEKKPNLAGQEIFTQRATHLAYEKRAAKINPDLSVYEAAKAAQPDRALEIDPMEYGKGHQVCMRWLQPGLCVCEFCVKCTLWAVWVVMDDNGGTALGGCFRVIHSMMGAGRRRVHVMHAE